MARSTPLPNWPTLSLFPLFPIPEIRKVSDCEGPHTPQFPKRSKLKNTEVEKEKSFVFSFFLSFFFVPNDNDKEEKEGSSPIAVFLVLGFGQSSPSTLVWSALWLAGEERDWVCKWLASIFLREKLFLKYFSKIELISCTKEEFHLNIYCQIQNIARPSRVCDCSHHHFLLLLPTRCWVSQGSFKKIPFFFFLQGLLLWHSGGYSSPLSSFRFCPQGQFHKTGGGRRIRYPLDGGSRAYNFPKDIESWIKIELKEARKGSKIYFFFSLNRLWCFFLCLPGLCPCLGLDMHLKSCPRYYYCDLGWKYEGRVA